MEQTKAKWLILHILSYSKVVIFCIKCSEGVSAVYKSISPSDPHSGSQMTVNIS